MLIIRMLITLLELAVPWRIILARVKKRDPLDTPPAELPRFSTGDVAKILDLKIWRLQKFVDVESYRLSPSGKLGKGPGSRRMFSAEDIYRIGIANFMIKDGFSPKLVAEVLQEFEDTDLFDFDEEGVAYPGITLSRSEKGPKLDFFRSGQAPERKPGSSVYYVLDFGTVIEEIDRRISKFEGKKEGRK